MIRVFRPLPVESLKLLVFDLDGTLADTAQDLCNSVNAALEHLGRPRLPDEKIAGFVGNGAPMMMRRALAAENGTSPDQVQDIEFTPAYAFFVQHYREHNLDFTLAYPGTVEALSALRSEFHGPQRTFAVLTNKPVRPARAICAGLGIAPYFLHIYGGDSFPAKKPDPMGLFSLMDETGAKPEETVMIGDSHVDVQTARNAGAWCVGCTFGLAPGSLEAMPPDVLVDSPADWTSALRPAKITTEQ
ncbi:MAG: HAD-IA family hydrolase [Terracidiphilus sp.]